MGKSTLPLLVIILAFIFITISPVVCLFLLLHPATFWEQLVALVVGGIVGIILDVIFFILLIVLAS